MSAEHEAKVAQAREAADALLQISMELCERPLREAAQIVGEDVADPFRELVRLEIAGSIAIDQILTRHMKQALRVCEPMPLDSRMHHLMQATVNPLVGAVMAFTNDMPRAMRRSFIQLLHDSLTVAEERHRAATAKAHKA